jgi:hypothetical protein
MGALALLAGDDGLAPVVADDAMRLSLEFVSSNGRSTSGSMASTWNARFETYPPVAAPA